MQKNLSKKPIVKKSGNYKLIMSFVGRGFKIAKTSGGGVKEVPSQFLIHRDILRMCGVDF